MPYHPGNTIASRVISLIRVIIGIDIIAIILFVFIILNEYRDPLAVATFVNTTIQFKLTMFKESSTIHSLVIAFIFLITFLLFTESLWWQAVPDVSTNRSGELSKLVFLSFLKFKFTLFLHAEYYEKISVWELERECASLCC